MAPKTKIEAAPKTSHNRARQHSYPSLSHQMWAWGHLGGPSRHRAPSSHTEPTSSCAERAGSQTKAGAGSCTERGSCIELVVQGWLAAAQSARAGSKF